MNFDEYQKESRVTASYPDIGNNFVYPTLGLAGETGEVVEKVKKTIREKEGKFDSMAKDDIKKEIGDVLWYMAQLATELGISLDDVARHNIEKLADRSARGKLHGSGDRR